MNQSLNQNDIVFGEQNQKMIDISSPFGFHLNLAQMEELQKNSVDLLSLSSPRISKSQSLNGNQQNAPKQSLFRFFKILQQKTHQIRQNRKKFSFFKKVYQEKIFRSEFKTKEKPSKYMIDPKNIFLLAFQYFKFLAMMSLLLIFTFLWSFQDFQEIREKNVVIYIIVAHVYDIFLQFNQAIIEKGKVIYQRVVICKKYFANSFFEDSIFLISLILLVYAEYFIFIPLFYFSGVIILFKIFKKLENLFDISQINMEILKLIKLLIFINLLAHFIACVWYQIGKNAIDAKRNWLDFKGIRDESQETLYITSFYFSVTTMITVGYGDITPQNNQEMLVCILIMFLSCGVYAYSLNLIGQILSAINQKQNSLEKNIRAINKYFKQHNVKDELQSRIKNYMEYKFQKEDNQVDNIYPILHQLSKNLKTKIVSHIYSEFLKSCPVLKENFSNSSLMKSSHLIEILNFEGGDFIINQNFPNENALYFIDSGIVEIYEPRSKTSIVELKGGQFFGEFEFFTNNQAKFSYKCKTNTKVFKLPRQNFVEILDKDDFETFHQIKHSYEFNIPIQQHECLACNKNGHVIHNCGILFYHPNIMKFTLREKNRKQSRQKVQRREDKTNTLSLLQFTQEKQFEYNERYQQELIEEIKDEQIEVAPESEISALQYNNQNKKQETQGSQVLRETSYRRLNTLVKTRQSLSEYTQYDQNGQNFPKLHRMSKRQLDAQNQLGFEFDRMKEFHKYFSEFNYETQINRCNQSYFNQSSVKLWKKKVSRPMRFIQI